MLNSIFKDNFMHEFYMETARKEVREEERQAQHQMLLTIVQVRFPTLSSLAQTQANQIKDVAVLEKLTTRVSIAKTEKEAERALLNCQQTNNSD